MRWPRESTRPGRSVASRVVTPGRIGRSHLVALVAVAILIGSVLPHPPAALGAPGPFGGVRLDRWLHVGPYALLAATVLLTLRGREVSRRHTVVLAFVVVVAYGLGMELLQLPLPTRAFDLVDLGADTVGAAMAVGLWWLRTTPSRPTD